MLSRRDKNLQNAATLQSRFLILPPETVWCPAILYTIMYRYLPPIWQFLLTVTHSTGPRQEQQRQRPHQTPHHGIIKEHKQHQHHQRRLNAQNDVLDHDVRQYNFRHRDALKTKKDLISLNRCTAGRRSNRLKFKQI